MNKTSSFQCPATGQVVAARYAFGKVTLEARDPDGVGIMPETQTWCQRHTNKRCRSLDEADEYLQQVSDGQVFGFY